MDDLTLADIQGNVLRGYNMDTARVFVLRIDSAPGARRFLGALVNGGDTSDLQITTAARWDAKPPYCLNVGITWNGLRALGLSDDSLNSFPTEFAAPLGEQAAKLGDVGESAPENWIEGLAWTDGAPSQAHILLLLYAQQKDTLDALTPALREQFTRSGACTELTHIDGEDLPDSLVHFGYVDGLSQPRIEGSLPTNAPDDQPPAPTGEFLLGYTNQYGFVYSVPTPEDLGKNGTFLAFRVLKQDVDGFEKFLEDNAPLVEAKPGVDPKELLAAKMCGRWRNGIPIALSPDTDNPDPPLPRERWNQFDYVPSAAYPDVIDDSKGYRCPIGSHMRRNNPRGGVVAGGGNHLHRIVRRGIPYGPPYDPTHPNDGIERGLLGIFFCGSLKDQFEFLMAEWVNQDNFGLHGDLDPLLGNNDPATSRFVIPVADRPKQPITITGFSRFITTRGSAYCFMPSVTALRYLANL